MLASSTIFADFHEAGLDALLEFAQAQFAAVERLAALNLNVARETIGDGRDYASALLVGSDTPELSRLGVALAMPALDRTLVYSLGVCELGSQAQANVARLVDAHATGFSNSLAMQLEKLMQYAPPGSGMAVKAVKSALQNANSAVDSLTEFGMKTSELAQTKIAALTAGIGQARGSSAKASVKNGKGKGGIGKRGVRTSEGSARTGKRARRKAA
jgi:phasin family protein